jgi:hypothetical protein
MQGSSGTKHFYVLIVGLLLAGCGQPRAESSDWMFGQWTTVEGTTVELSIDADSIDIFVPGRSGGLNMVIVDRYRILGVSGDCVRTQRLGDQRTSRTSTSGERRSPAPDDRITFCRRADRQMLVRHIPIHGATSEVLYSRNIAGEIVAALSRVDIAAEVTGSPDRSYAIVQLTHPQGREAVASAANAISRISYVKRVTPMTAERAAELVGQEDGTENIPQLNLIEVELD